MLGEDGRTKDWNLGIANVKNLQRIGVRSSEGLK